MMNFKAIACVGVNVAFLVGVGVAAYSYDVNVTNETFDNSFTHSVHVTEVNPLHEYLASLDTEETYCLAQNIYFEARNQSIEGQYAVARVTMNRVDASNYPDTICDVVWQRKQFSWTHDGLSDTPGGDVIEDAAWELAQDVALSSLIDHFQETNDITLGATHYHANYVNPYWKDSYQQVAYIGEHMFYK